MVRQGASGQRRRILDAAAKLFAERGFHRTTIEQIAHSAGIAEAAFYEVFEDEEECFLALFDRLIAEAERRIGESVAAESGAWPDQVRAALNALFGLAEVEPLAVRACLGEALVVGPAAVKRYERLRDELAPLLRSGRELKLRSAELPEALEETLAGGVLWMLQQRLLAGQAEHLDELLPEALQFLVAPYVGEEDATRLASGRHRGAGARRK